MRTTEVLGKSANRRICNSALTRRVIEAQSKGYDLDFCLINDGKIVCIQSNVESYCSNVEIMLVDQVFDSLSITYQYIYLIDSGNGEKGLLIMSNIYAGNSLF